VTTQEPSRNGCKLASNSQRKEARSGPTLFALLRRVPFTVFKQGTDPMTSDSTITATYTYQ